MSKIEIFRNKAAELEEFAAGEESDGLRASYLTLGQSHRQPFISWKGALAR
jgi:hypothetical protein